MKRITFVMVLSMLLTAIFPAMAFAATIPTDINYGNVTLSGGFQSGNFPQVWDLTACDMTISFEYDAIGLSDVAGAHAWSELGIRTLGAGNFNPSAGNGVWLATDYDWTVGTFGPDPVGSPTLDMDDKLILQKVGGQGEGAYDQPSTPPIPGNNHRFWFDRDGVDQWQALSPLAVDGGTYNTGGTYDMVLTLQAGDATNGTAYMTINGLDQGFETDGNWNTMELSPAGMTFTGDMTQMQVFYGLYGYGATHSVSFNHITVSGCLRDIQGPITTNVVASINPAAVGSSVILTANVDDTTTGGSNIASAEYSLEGGTWFAMSAQDNAFDEVSEDVSASFTATSTPGVYQLCVRGTDVFANVGDSECIIFVVYDPSGGFVTGGGWIMSPVGAYSDDPTLTGKATFGFVAKYKKGANVPDGNTEFQFKTGDLNFHSTSYEWLVVAGMKAQFKGVGSINGQGTYKFMIFADDDSPDTFRIQIWDDNGTVYDNGSQQSLGGGSIVIHKS